MGYGLKGSLGNIGNMANNIVLVHVDVKIPKNPLHQVPQAVCA